MNLKNTYIFTPNTDKQIKIEALFEEEAIRIFQKKHPRIGPKYYMPTVFTKIELETKTIMHTAGFKRKYR